MSSTKFILQKYTKFYFFYVQILAIFLLKISKNSIRSKNVSISVYSLISFFFKQIISFILIKVFFVKKKKQTKKNKNLCLRYLFQIHC